MNDLILSSQLLTDEQSLCVPLLAMGLTIEEVANMQKLPSNRIKNWMTSDFVFINAVDAAKSSREQILKDNLDKAGFLATQYAIDVLSKTPDFTDIEGRRNQANIAKSVLAMVSSRKVDVKLQPVPMEEKVSNIDQSSKAIVERHMGHQPEYVVLNNAEILIDEPILHIDCEYGKFNYQGDALQCHICGKFSNDFVIHIRTAHMTSPPRYRELYKIPESIPFFVDVKDE